MIPIELIERAVIDSEDTIWRVYAGGPAPRIWTPLLLEDVAQRVAHQARTRLIDANIFNEVEIRLTPIRKVCGVEIFPKR